METMSSAAVKRLHEDLRAAVTAGVPFRLGKSKSPDLPGGKADLRKLAALEDAVGGWMAQGQSLRQVASHDRELPKQFRAALRVYAETGVTHPVLDGLMARGVFRRQLSALLRRILAYLFLLMGLASILLLFFSMAIVPSIVEVRRDMQIVPALATERAADGTGGLPLIILAFGTAATIGLVALVSGGAPEIAWLFGSRRMQTTWLSASAVQTVQLLIANGVPLGEATSIACELVDDTGRVHRQIDVAVRARTESAEPVKHLNALASEYRSMAAIQLATLRVVLPIALLCVVGGIVVMIYGVAVFLPIVLLLKDLAIPTS